MRHNRCLLVWSLSALALLAGGCLVIENQFSGLPPGPWRAVLKLDPVPVTPNPRGEPLPEKVNLQFEEVTQGELPFNFEVVYDREDRFHLELINGEERIRIDDITIGLDRQTAKDTVVIDFPVFDSYIRAIFEQNVMEGEWIVRNRENYAIPFVAHHGQRHRFTTLRKEPVMDLSGRWEVTFEIDTDSPYPAVAEFEQEGNYLTGTFLTETGDYRYLEGTVQADKLYLSTFDGAHAYLFEAKISPDSQLIGSFRSGIHYQTLWEARPNPSARLRDPAQLTQLREDRLRFTFPDAAGEPVSLDDPRYRGKAKVVYLFGTWCPNCRDATNFLVDYLKEEAPDDLAVIGLAFEKYREAEKAQQAIRTYRKEMDLPYEVLHAGYYEKEAAAEALPLLDSLLAYPTLLFVDRDNTVRFIHTGFAGPATEAYDSFKTTFADYVDRLLADPAALQ